VEQRESGCLARIVDAAGKFSSSEGSLGNGDGSLAPMASSTAI